MPSTSPKKSTGTRSSAKTRNRARSGSRRSQSSRSAARSGARHPATAALPVLGHCGGRPLLSPLERDVCDHLTSLGVVHSHRPRHFEVTLENGTRAAYAPTMVVRGRGREGKSVVVETADEADGLHVDKIRAYRKQYGVEFYLCLVGSQEVLEDLRLDAYDECSTLADINTMVGRLAE